MVDISLNQSKHGHTNFSLLRKTYIYQLCENTECCLENLPRAIANEDKWWESKVSMPSAHIDNDDHSEI